MYQPRLAHMPEHVHDKKEKEKKNAPKDCENGTGEKATMQIRNTHEHKAAQPT